MCIRDSRNAGRLRLKESDRIEAMQTELRKMGARIEVDGDTVHLSLIHI